MSESLFASVLLLSRADCQALRMTDPYSLHRIVYSMFPDVRSEKDKQGSVPSGIQFADMGGDARGRKVLLLSDRQPTANVDGQYGEVRSQLLPENFLDHHQYRFRLIVNPTRRDSASKKLIPVRGREAIVNWFMERAEANWGFVVDPQCLQVERVEVQRFTEKGGREVTLAQAHLAGVLRVSDATDFRNSFSRGIGRGRAFGCGLLQIVPISSQDIQFKG